jgi:ribonuclease P protein component
MVVVHLDAPADDLSATEVPDDTAPAPTERTDLPVRAGFVVPKTVGNAVVRNKVRRRLRHLVRERLAALPAGATVVVRALPGAAGRSFPELADDLDAALVAARKRRPRRSRGEGT